MQSQPPTTVFIGVTGASGAVYAERLLRVLAPEVRRLTLVVSDSGLVVLRHELELGGDRDEVVAELLDRSDAVGVTDVYHPDDMTAPAASGSNFPDAAVICPCSLSTVAHVALGTTRNLIHRAGAVAIKERRPFVVVPRETPLSPIHLRRLLELAEVGAVVLPAMPAFYTKPRSLDEAVDQVVGKVLQELGFEQRLFAPWDGGAH